MTTGIGDATPALTAEEAVLRAREIAARLSGGIGSTSMSSVSYPKAESTAGVPAATTTAPPTTSPSAMEPQNSINDQESGIGHEKSGNDGSAAHSNGNNGPGNGMEGDNDNNNGTKKRKRWGVMPPNGGILQPQATTTGTPVIPPNVAVLDAAAAEAAMQARAKALAAVAKAISPSALLMMSTPKPKIPPVAKRVWVTAAMLTEERPAAHFVAFAKRRFPDILDKLNAEALAKKKADLFLAKKKEEVLASLTNSKDDKSNTTKDDSKDDDLVTIEFKGKGASDKPPILGMPEKPLHVYIHGPKLLVEQAEMQVEDILEEAKTAPIEEEAINARLAAEGALTTTTSNVQPIPSTTSYRPASVAQLIGQAFMATAAAAGANGHSHQLSSSGVEGIHGATIGGLIEETIGIPNGIVGYIIGRGGENIASMQSKTGCKVQIQKEHELQPGQTERVITLQATSRDAIDACRSIIEQMVADRIKAVSGSSGSSNNNNHYRSNNSNNNSDHNTNMKSHQQQSQDPVQLALSLGHKLVEVDVPDADVGLVIGKGGGTIKSIQEQTGSTIQVPKTGNADNPAIRTLQITCLTEQGALAAKEMVENVLKTKPGYQQQMRMLQQQSQGATGLPHQQIPECSIQVRIPDNDVGLCIGKQGCVIRYMQNTTRTKIQIPPTVSQPGDTHRTATIIGPSLEACNHVRQMIEKIIAEQSSMSIMALAAAAAQQQQQQHHGYYDPAAGQQQVYPTYHTGAQSGGYGHQLQQYQYSAQQHYSGGGYYAEGAVQQQEGGYSAEWAAYHAAVAAQQQQQQLQQLGWAQDQLQQQVYATDAAANKGTMAGSTPVANTASGAMTLSQTTISGTTESVGDATVQAQPAPDAYYEQFFRHAYYYGEEAARAHYGAWSPPVGTPNPYGVNPNLQLVSSATTTAAASSAVLESGITHSTSTSSSGVDVTTATSDAAAAAMWHQNESALAAADAAARETSRRQVSNLPAWMTKK